MLKLGFAIFSLFFSFFAFAENDGFVYKEEVLLKRSIMHQKDINELAIASIDLYFEVFDRYFSEKVSFEMKKNLSVALYYHSESIRKAEELLNKGYKSLALFQIGLNDAVTLKLIEIDSKIMNIVVFGIQSEDESYKGVFM